MAELNMNLLAVALEPVVLDKIEDMKRVPLALVLGRPVHIAETLAYQGERMQNATTVSEAREALSRLAQAVARAAFQPDGVRVLGLAFKAKHPDQQT